jgi:hypothetical protein
VIQCDQTSVLATSITLHSEGEKCDDCYKGQSSFLLRVRLRHVNHIDCACGGVVIAGRRWLGILSARLALETAAHRAHPLARGHHRSATHHAAEAAKARIEHRGKGPCNSPSLLRRGIVSAEEAISQRPTRNQVRFRFNRMAIL